MRSLKDPRIPRQDHLDLATHFYVDRYATMAQVERSWGNTSRPVSDYLCSYCLMPHNKSAFDTDELAKGPEERACIGAIGSIHTCAHRSFTHMQLLLAMRGRIVSSFERTQTTTCKVHPVVPRHLQLHENTLEIHYDSAED
jgi:hypothetical protein